MRIGIAGPLGTPDIEHLLEGDTRHLPREMKGATLLVTLIETLLGLGHEISAFSTDPALEPSRHNRVVARGHRFTMYYVPRRRHALRSDRGRVGGCWISLLWNVMRLRMRYGRNVPKLSMRIGATSLAQQPWIPACHAC